MKQAFACRFSLFLFVIIASGLSFSCGIEDYSYLDPSPSGSVRLTLNNRAIVFLPDQGSLSDFTHYALYYRIYVSDIQESGEIQRSRPAMERINPALANDYFYLEPYTSTNNNVNNTSTAALFRNRNYQVLDNVVGNGPGDLELNFPVQTGSTPYLTYRGGASYSLYRSNGDGAFNPRPDRYFRNSSELNSSANVSSTINADVADKAGASGFRYTYVALYIVAVGLNKPAYTPFYSIPTFIGVFRLPEKE